MSGFGNQLIQQDKKKPISILTTRVNSIIESIDQLKITMDDLIQNQFVMNSKIEKISDKIFNKPEFLTVGDIALKEGVSQRTVRRRLKDNVIPYHKDKGDKAYRIPSKDYYQSISQNGKSIWFQNHT